MKNNQYSLQLLNHAECFETREKAIQYINEEFKNNALMAEPALVFYGEPDEPNVILSFGTVDRKVFMIDAARMDDAITEIASSSDEAVKDIVVLKSAVKEIVESCGLVWDENKKNDQISYEPDIKDELISNCQTLSEAVDIISKYVQAQFKENKLSVVDSKSISLIFEDNDNGGKTLKAAIKFSTDGNDDDLLFNDNIVGLKPDGVFACANLHYDEEKRQLIFTTSGMRNGKFVDDAKKQIVNLGEHTQYDAKNGGHTVKVSVNKEENTISADVKLSDDENNILVEQDGKLLVDGKATNIKYKNKTVFKGLNDAETSIESIKTEIERINDSHFIEGNTTDTVVITAEKLPLGNHRVTGDVRLGSNESIKIMNGGLEADVEVSTNVLESSLTLRVGNKTSTVKLPGAQLVKTIYYDSVTKEIVIIIDGEPEMRVPISDLFKEWDVENESTSPITLNKKVSPDSKTPDMLSADIKLADNDNLLQVVDGKLLAPESKITTAVGKETARAVAAEKDLGSLISINTEKIDNEKERATAAETQINGDIALLKQTSDTLVSSVEENKQNVSNISDRLLSAEATISQNSNSIAENKSSISSNTESLNGLTERVSLSEQNVENINNLVKGLDDKNQNLAIALGNIHTEITTETDRAKDKESELLGLIEKETINRVTSDDQLKESIQNVSNEVDVLNGDVNTSGSIRELVSHVIGDVTDSVNSQVEAINGQITDLKTKDSELKTEIESKVGSVTLSNPSKLVYVLMVDGEEQGIINIPKDQFLQNVSYDPNSKNITFTFITSEEPVVTTINIADLIDEYEAGNGLTLNGNVFDVTISAGSENYLTVNENGISLNGINEALNNKVNKEDLSEYVKNETFTTVQTNLEVLSKTVKDNTDKIVIINGNEAEIGSVLNAIKVSETYTDEKISEQTTKLDELKTDIDAKLQTKANVGDSYTKQEIDNKGFLVNSDIVNLATKTDVENVKAQSDANKSALDIVNGGSETKGSINNAILQSKNYIDEQITSVTENIRDINAKDAEQDNKINLLESEAKRLNLVKEDTDTVSMNVSKTDEGTKLSSNVRINQADTTNIIKVDGNGLYANVNLTYNSATNTLLFNNGSNNGVKIKLSDTDSLVTNGYYDSVNKKIVLIISTNGTTKEVEIEVNDLLNLLEIEGDSTGNPIKLSLATNEDGVKILSARLDISTKKDNLILNNNGTLYASADANDHKAEDIINGTTSTVQRVLNNLGLEVVKIDTLSNEVTKIKDDVTQLNANVVLLSTKVDSYESRINAVENTVADMQKSMTQLLAEMEQVKNVIDNLLDAGVYEIPKDQETN